MPQPLPPTISWSADLAAALSRADFAIGRLAGEAKRNRVYCAHAILGILEESPRLPRSERMHPRGDGS